MSDTPDAPTLTLAPPPARRLEALWGLFGGTRPGSALPVRLFLRGLGAVYLFAFLPWAVQILGVIGSEGVEPAGTFLQTVYAAEGLAGVLHYPSLAWISSSDAVLQAIPIAGIALALLLVVGYTNTLVLGSLWALYLSIVTISGDYGLYGWSATLLEAGLLGLLLVPLRLTWRSTPVQAPPRLVVWAAWWLIFRLWFSMGVVKFYDGDPAWLRLTFLSHFYPNQPLPTPGAWLLAQLPMGVHKAAALVVAVVELAVPFLIFWNRKTRLAAALIFAATSGFLFVSGHYAFFHLLVLLLCVLLLDAGHLHRLRSWLRAPKEAPPRPRAVRLANAGAVPILLLGAFYLAALFLPGGRGPFNHLNYRVFDPVVLEKTSGLPLQGVAVGLLQTSARFYLVNPIGEFKRIPRIRYEVVFEGSLDGETWLPYGFHDKPDDVDDAPAWTAPYMDHLGTQLYYEAQGLYFYRFDRRSDYDEGRPPRLLALAERLRQGSPAVLRLLDEDPFEGRPPAFVRCSLYRFGFTDLGTLRREGAWWWREFEQLLLTNHPEGGASWHGPLLEPPLNGRVQTNLFDGQRQGAQERPRRRP
ncbi:MAG: lipase maturation factor family protein [Rubricoccaceae bacterium]|nr:lipase maturation factor family protein [Rubricoccaceae bacterium]